MKLLSPLDVGPITLKNRVVSTAHGAFLDFYRPGVSPDQYIGYQRRRAEGGCGFIILQAMQVHPSSQPQGHFMWERDDILPKFDAMSSALHAPAGRSPMSAISSTRMTPPTAGAGGMTPGMLPGG